MITLTLCAVINVINVFACMQDTIKIMMLTVKYLLVAAIAKMTDTDPGCLKTVCCHATMEHIKVMTSNAFSL